MGTVADDILDLQRAFRHRDFRYLSIETDVRR
jgi:hypothetical protein